jgi:outer membrane protein OmpA-like peptidoglycan-associated protein
MSIALKLFCGLLSIAAMLPTIVFNNPNGATVNSETQGTTNTRIPLCAGLTIVTAISQTDGDYESIKTIESVTDQQVRLKYSSERMVQDLMDNEPKLQRATISRTVLTKDLANANLYQQQFYDQLPDPIPGTTAIGTSTAVLNELKTKGEAELGFFIAFTGSPSLDREVHPNVFDNQMIGTFQRVEPGPVMLPIIVNNVAVQLPTIHIMGDFVGDKTEFYFLDDPANPIALKWRYGIDSIPEEDVKKFAKSGMKLNPDRDRLQVIKITYRCGNTASGDSSGQAGQQPPTPPGNSDSGQLEKSLASTGRADVYDIYFTFNSDQIRDESEPRLKEIADALNKHPDWKLSVEGHTDSVGNSNYNLDLSRRRASAVKDALVKRYKIDPNRLTTVGYGATRPKDTNDTLEGRARNRRVELVRQ